MTPNHMASNLVAIAENMLPEKWLQTIPKLLSLLGKQPMSTKRHFPLLRPEGVGNKASLAKGFFMTQGTIASSLTIANITLQIGWKIVVIPPETPKPTIALSEQLKSTASG